MRPRVGTAVVCVVACGVGALLRVAIHRMDERPPAAAREEQRGRERRGDVPTARRRASIPPVNDHARESSTDSVARGAAAVASDVAQTTRAAQPPAWMPSPEATAGSQGAFTHPLVPFGAWLRASGSASAPEAERIAAGEMALRVQAPMLRDRIALHAGTEAPPWAASRFQALRAAALGTALVGRDFDLPIDPLGASELFGESLTPDRAAEVERVVGESQVEERRLLLDILRRALTHVSEDAHGPDPVAAHYAAEGRVFLVPTGALTIDGTERVRTAAELVEDLRAAVQAVLGHGAGESR